MDWLPVMSDLAGYFERSDIECHPRLEISIEAGRALLDYVNNHDLAVRRARPYPIYDRPGYVGIGVMGIHVMWRASD